MRFVAVLNRDGGSLRTTDLDVFSGSLKEILEAGGHTVEIRIVSGDQLVAALDEVCAIKSVDAVIAGGGDGTTSAAAAKMMGSEKILAILPAGTMNLFSRSLGIPQGLDAALRAFADGEVRAVDVATANGRPFIHQFSIGMHAKLVHLREKMEFASRLGKMRASAKAAYGTLMNPPSINVMLTVGEAEIVTRTTGVGITNNLFGEHALPYADKPDGGVLGIYVTIARERSEILRFLLSMLRGKWRDNDQVEIHQAANATLNIRSPVNKFRCVIDGELFKLERETVLKIHPGVLRVLVPREASNAEAAA
ncbi:MAG: diacylglycerol kinase family lipid kinase [Pseudaminobacter sp.]|nr:diacylglycerol kinase family lipid kinase [Pseudaminobacter sp.]